MGYVDAILEPDERVVFRTSLSWTLYGRAIGLAILALALPAVAAGVAGWGGPLVFGASALAGLAAFLSFLHAWFAGRRPRLRSPTGASSSSAVSSAVTRWK